MEPLEITQAGPDVLRIVWTDGHDSGIYTFEHLRALCPCPECRGMAR